MRPQARETKALPRTYTVSDDFTASPHCNANWTASRTLIELVGPEESLRGFSRAGFEVPLTDQGQCITQWG
ncbi:hypothetical protein [Streptomyces sp. NPDC057428]|uniref:hypothetical protein n=1 Tax=Streptomyces sp. NPDC057428 TaxID=3346129 RepID=UPI00369B1C25